MVYGAFHGGIQSDNSDNTIVGQFIQTIQFHQEPRVRVGGDSLARQDKVASRRPAHSESLQLSCRCGRQRTSRVLKNIDHVGSSVNFSMVINSNSRRSISPRVTATSARQAEDKRTKQMKTKTKRAAHARQTSTDECPITVSKRGIINHLVRAHQTVEKKKSKKQVPKQKIGRHTK